MKLVHLSDPHVQLPRWRERSLRELGPLRALATVELWKGRGRDFERADADLRALVAQTLAADHVVVTGDLTQLGHEEEFALARAALGPLAADARRFTTLPGNHDRFPLGAAPNRLFEKYFPEQAQSDRAGPLRVRLVGEELALIIVDTPGELSWPLISRGKVDAAALTALPGTLRSLEGRCRLLLVHHAPLRRSGRGDFPWHSLSGARALLRAAAEGGAEAVLCGHIHDRYDVPAAPGRPRVLCAGSSTERGQQGYWELEIEGTRIASAMQRLLVA